MTLRKIILTKKYGYLRGCKYWRANDNYFHYSQCFIFGGGGDGTNHCDELGYLFKTMLTPEIRLQSPEGIAVRRIIKLWTTFARNGNPNPIESDPLIPVKWPPTENGMYHFLDIGENLTVGTNPEAERVAFWDKIYALSESKCKL